MFLDFIKSLLNDLSYLMEDSFDRIADVQNISAIKEDATKWAALPAHEKRTKESFLQSQVRHQHNTRNASPPCMCRVCASCNACCGANISEAAALH